MKPHPIFSYSLVSSTIVLCALILGTSTFADGLRSQWKVRMPQFAVSADPSAMLRFHPTDISLATMPTPEQEHIALIVREKVRLATRVARNDRAQRLPEQTTVQTTNVTPGNGIDRELLVLRGRKNQSLECNLLHTHEKARCFYEAQMKKVVRVQSVNAVVSR